MARSFTAATTDAVASNQGTRFSSRTYCIWSNRSGATAFHRMFENTNNGFFLDTTDTTYRFNQNFSVANGQWSVTAAGTGSWTFCGITWDDTADTNDPSVWINTTKNTIGSGLTEVLTPSGTPLSSHANLRIGNRPAGDRSWNGALARFAQWSVILDDSEMDALAKGAHPTFIRPASLVEHIEMLRDNVSTKLAAPTITGTTVSDHPRLLFPQRKTFYFAAATGGATTFPVSANATAVGTAFVQRQLNKTIVVAAPVFSVAQRQGNLTMPEASASGFGAIQRQGNLNASARSVGTASLVSALLVRMVNVLATAVSRVSLFQRQANLNVTTQAVVTPNVRRSSTMALAVGRVVRVSVQRLGLLVIFDATVMSLFAISAQAVGTATVTLVGTFNRLIQATASVLGLTSGQPQNVLSNNASVSASVTLNVTTATPVTTPRFTGAASLAYVAIRRRGWKRRR